MIRSYRPCASRINALFSAEEGSLVQRCGEHIICSTARLPQYRAMLHYWHLMLVRHHGSEILAATIATCRPSRCHVLVHVLLNNWLHDTWCLGETVDGQAEVVVLLFIIYWGRGFLRRLLAFADRRGAIEDVGGLSHWCLAAASFDVLQVLHEGVRALLRLVCLALEEIQSREVRVKHCAEESVPVLLADIAAPVRSDGARPV